MIDRIVRVGVAAVLALSVAGAAPAVAKGGDVIREEACSGSADWKLKLSPQDGRIEVEYEVDSNVCGQRWRVRITKNGNQIFRGARTTHTREPLDTCSSSPARPGRSARRVSRATVRCAPVPGS